VVGLARVHDDRGSATAGKVGAATINTSTDIDDYLYASMKNGLVQKGLSVVDAPSPGSAGAQAFKGKIVVVSLQSVSIGTPDALLFPANATAAIAVQVFDQQPKVIYAQTFSGTMNGTLGVHTQSGYEDETGKMIAAALDQAVNSRDQGLSTAAK